MTTRRINLAQTLKMYEAYTAGATMEAVGEQFHYSKSAVQKAFASWNLPVSEGGSPRRQVIDIIPAARSIAYEPPSKSFVWCEQCDQRVVTEKAAACTSPFCKAKALAA